jgi:hypothetical protein
MQKGQPIFDKKLKKWDLKLLALFYTLITGTFKYLKKKIGKSKILTTKLGSFISLCVSEVKVKNKP